MILEQINIIEFVLLFCTAFKLIYPRFNKPIYCANAEQNGQLAAWSIDLIRAKWVVLFFCLGFSSHINAQSPHGPDFKVNCADCHLTTSWEIPYDAWDRKGPVFSKTTGWQIGWDTAKFSHTKTNFPLTGQHIRVDCRTCHESLVFSEAKSDCFACHTDVHQQTLGMDCTRCHNTENWLVDFIPELHQDNGFPLLGAHAVASCTDCHTSETQLRFDRIGNDCINCHLDDFQTTKSPDHVKAGFSTNCVDCHDPAKTDWGTTLVDHSFFPLEKGHQINDCTACHSGGTFSNTPPIATPATRPTTRRRQTPTTRPPILRSPAPTATPPMPAGCRPVLPDTMRTISPFTAANTRAHGWNVWIVIKIRATTPSLPV